MASLKVARPSDILAPVASATLIPMIFLPSVACQEERDADDGTASLYNRRGNKDSQLR